MTVEELNEHTINSNVPVIIMALMGFEIIFQFPLSWMGLGVYLIAQRIKGGH